jgi:hypothetical protein
VLSISDIGHAHKAGQTGHSAASSAGALEAPKAAVTPAVTSGASAAQPGPPGSRLAPGSQTLAQEASNDNGASARNEGEAAPQAGAKENAEGEKVNQQGLTEAEQRQVEKLKQRDREVREHERAHATAGGTIAGSPSYTFQSGPDGKQYAVGGEVSIDVSPVSGNPQATIRKMEQVKRAALAPSNPSAQDRRVASQADAAIIQAKQELAEERREEQAESQSSTEATGRSLGTQDPVFDPEKRFKQPVGNIGGPLGTGLAGGGELKTNVGLTNPGDLLNIVA